MPSLTRAITMLAAFLAMASAAHGQAILSPAGQPPGYYPGLANGVPAYLHEQWQQWAHARKPAILALRARIDAARASGKLPGCIGQSVEDCIVTLAQDLAIADEYTNSTLFDTPEVDVNGKPIGPKLVEIFAFLPGGAAQPQDPALQIPYLQDRYPLFLHLSDANKITEIGLVENRHSILLARTEAEYDQTAVYEILSPLTRTQCPKLSRLELDRFIENKLKAPARKAKETGAARSYIKTKSSPLLPFCGRRLQLEIVLDRSKWPHHDPQIGAVLLIR